MTPKELRATAQAARQAFEAAQTDPTMTNSELKRLKAEADRTHREWIDGTTDNIIDFMNRGRTQCVTPSN